MLPNVYRLLQLRNSTGEVANSTVGDWNRIYACTSHLGFSTREARLHCRSKMYRCAYVQSFH